MNWGWAIGISGSGEGNTWPDWVSQLALWCRNKLQKFVSIANVLCQSLSVRGSSRLLNNPSERPAL